MSKGLLTQEKLRILGEYVYEICDAAKHTEENCYAKQGIIKPFDAGHKECDRCLACNKICECCVQVCPNRANIALDVKGLDMPQIIHIDRMCNECGNCLVFCPYSSRPYKEKLTLFSTEKEFRESDNPGFFYLGDKKFLLRTEGTAEEIDLDAPEGIDMDVEKILLTVLCDYRYLLG